MADELLEYYNRELTFIRQLAAEFAEAHPKIAERLRLSPDDAADDPHVERLIEAFAYLTARIRHKLDDEFPEITASLLDVLYPHYLAPIPSMAIVQFKLDPEQVQLTTGYTIPRAHGARDRADPGRAVPVPDVLPGHALADRAEAGQPRPGARSPARQPPSLGEAAAVLRLGLSCSDAGDDVRRRWVWTSLRFFLRGQPQHVYRLYELIFNNTIGVAVAGSTQAIPTRRARPRLPAPGRLRSRRGNAPVPGALVPGLPAADRVLRVPTEVPLRRPGAARARRRSPGWAISWRSTSS